MRAQRADWANLQYYSVYSIMNVMNGVLVVTLLGYRVPSKTTNLGEYQIRYYIIHYFNVLFHFNTIPYYMCQDYTTAKQNNKLQRQSGVALWPIKAFTFSTYKTFC